MPFPTWAICLLGLPLSSAALSLSGNYTPTHIQCPAGETFVRNASHSLSTEETAWLEKRRPNVVRALETYLSNVGIEGFNVSEYISALNNTPHGVPTIGLTWSGGGTRAQSSDYGQMYSFDGRVSAAVNARTGGLLQATTYVAGLSGGATGLGPVAMADFQNIEDMFQEGLLSVNFSSNAFNEMLGKAKQGFNLSVSDIFAIALGANTLKIPGNDSVDPLSRLWSDITTFSNFSAGLSPMPILLYTEVIPAGLPGHNAYNGFLIPADNARLNGTYYEATPFEVGSWQGRASAFVKTNYLGTRFDNGQPINDTCVNGFETAAFMVGAADAAMNFWVASVQSNGTVGQFAKRSHDSKTKVPYPPHEDKIEQERLASSFVDMVGELPRYLQGIGNPPAEEAVYGLWPNPFQNSSSADVHLRTQKLLWITDGSEYGQENPIIPLIQKARAPDFIVVNDAGGSELSSGWMNGTSFVNTADWAKHSNLPFPKIPSVNTILNLNHTLFPTFYGCHEKDVPLILYAADAPYTEYSNITAIDTAESSLEQHVRLWNNTLNIYSQPKNLRPHITTDLPTCIACGSILRSLQRLHKPIPDACRKCFKEHCWDGKEDHSQPGFLAPALLYDPEVSFAQWNASFYASATTNSTGNSSSSGL